VISKDYPIERNIPHECPTPYYAKFLDGSHFGLPDEHIPIKDIYIWTFREFNLPIKITFDAMMKENSKNEDICELIPVFSHNKKEWGKEGADALSWYLSINRCDFTFRKKVFGEFPEGRQF
jgi:hypothetical protein